MQQRFQHRLVYCLWAVESRKMLYLCLIPALWRKTWGLAQAYPEHFSYLPVAQCRQRRFAAAQLPIRAICDLMYCLNILKGGDGTRPQYNMRSATTKTWKYVTLSYFSSMEILKTFHSAPPDCHSASFVPAAALPLLSWHCCSCVRAFWNDMWMAVCIRAPHTDLFVPEGSWIGSIPVSINKSSNLNSPCLWKFEKI